MFNQKIVLTTGRKLSQYCTTHNIPNILQSIILVTNDLLLSEMYRQLPGMVAHWCNPCTGEDEAEVTVSLWAVRERSCFKKRKKRKVGRGKEKQTEKEKEEEVEKGKKESACKKQ